MLSRLRSRYFMKPLKPNLVIVVLLLLFVGMAVRIDAGFNFMLELLHRIDFNVWWNAIGALLFVAVIVVCIRNLLEIETEERKLEDINEKSYVTIKMHMKRGIIMTVYIRSVDNVEVAYVINDELQEAFVFYGNMPCMQSVMEEALENIQAGFRKLNEKGILTNVYTEEVKRRREQRINSIAQ